MRPILKINDGSTPLQNIEQSLRERIAAIRSEVARRALTGAAEFEFVREKLSKLPIDLREPCEYLYFQAHSIGIARVEGKYSVANREHSRELRYFWVSFGLLILIIVLSLIVPSPTPWQMNVLRTIIALASAGFVAFLPGMLTVQGAIKENSFLNKTSVKASGAFAVFLLVYYYVPTILRN
ncbi:hypothetical protein [Edaphobacter flagellatus]|uniref:hypothetical protein n=1 Tax=Edaphobacter flagellatus TaxID=1933044 RepID=UPI0021B3B196|nr:hypothetical protein [Edaphobacter flagellatus]